MKSKNLLYKKLVGTLLKNGKKNAAKRIIDETLFNASIATGISPYAILGLIYSSLAPQVEVRAVRNKRRTHLVPFYVNKTRRMHLVIKWLFEGAESNSQKLPFSYRLEQEIKNLVTEEFPAKALEKKANNARLAVIHRSNMHYRW